MRWNPRFHGRRALAAISLAGAFLIGMFALRQSTSLSEEQPAARATVRDDAGKLLDCEVTSAEAGSTALKELLGRKATVCVFLATECPISNGYVATLNQFARTLGEQGVAVVGLNSNDGPSLREIAAHRKEFAIAFPVLKDAGATVARQLNVDQCPTAVLLDAQGEVRYRGRIDDRHSKRGGPANEVRRHDLQIAIQELLAGRSVSVEKTDVVGCPIARRSARTKADAADVSYSEHIAPLMQRHCQRCHRPGGIGPFSLLTFDQAVSWSDDLKAFTANRQMPPWLPVDGFGEFHNRRAMSADEIALVAKWVDRGCPEGDRQRLPAPVQFAEGWSLGEPDLIVQPSEPFDVPADGKDVYRCFVLPTEFTENRFVDAIEVRPGNNRVVHHVIVFLDTTNASTKLDAKDPGPGYSTLAGFPGFLPAGGLGGWAPGNLPRRLRAGMARVLPPGAKMVVQVHYHPSGKVERDQTQIGLYFSKEPVTRTVRSILVMPFGGPLSGMRIPAGESNVEVQCSMTLPRDVLALVVTPHMHLLGKDMTLTATRPDGTVLPLIKVTRWDFNWQESYQYREPVSLPKGTRLELVAHYDNSDANPSNPRHPPRNVRWGENTFDEMCIAFLEVVPAEEARSQKDLKAPSPGELLKEALVGKLKDSMRQKAK